MPLLRRVVNLFSRSRVDRAIDAEIQSHIELRIEDNLAAGMSAAEASRSGAVTANALMVSVIDSEGIAIGPVYFAEDVVGDVPSVV